MSGTIYIDADACPVREEAVRVADRHGMKAVIVSNGGIRPSAHPTAELIIVADGPDEADKWIADHVGAGDICVTGDIPLAARVVEAGAAAIKPNGEALTERNVREALAMRDLMTDFRAANPLAQGGGQKPFSKSDRGRFLDALDRLVRATKR
ncbi:MAG: YaiI/YqxD family protein [Neomegalonema sp.]|nr:YaiI/YqxD family protein [Neomegalonema sp.]